MSKQCINSMSKKLHILKLFHLIVQFMLGMYFIGIEIGQSDHIWIQTFRFHLDKDIQIASHIVIHIIFRYRRSRRKGNISVHVCFSI